MAESWPEQRRTLEAMAVDHTVESFEQASIRAALERLDAAERESSEFQGAYTSAAEDRADLEAKVKALTAACEKAAACIPRGSSNFHKDALAECESALALVKGTPP